MWVLIFLLLFIGAYRKWYAQKSTSDDEGPLPVSLLLHASEFQQLRKYNAPLHDKIQRGVLKVNSAYESLRKGGDSDISAKIYELETRCDGTLSKFWELLRYCHNDLHLETACIRRLRWLDNHFRMLIHDLRIRSGAHTRHIHGAEYWQQPFPAEGKKSFGT